MNQREVDKIDLPEKFFLKKLIDATIISKIAIIGFVLITLALITTIIVIISRPQLITYIDKNTGETHAVMSASLNRNILKRQIMYVSKEFTENYLSLDGGSVIEKRKKALKLLSPKTLKKVKRDEYYQTAEVRDAINENYDCTFKWSRQPVITEENHPRYVAFMQFERILKIPDHKPIVQPFNIKIEWVWIEGIDPFEKPHNLSVIEFKDLDQNSEEFKNQLNLSYK